VISILIIIYCFVPAVSGLLFPTNSEATFANYKLWQSIGRIQAFSYSSLLCTDIKLYILIAFFIVGITAFLIVYFCFIRTLRESSSSTVLTVTKEVEDKVKHKGGKVGPFGGGDEWITLNDILLNFNNFPAFFYKIQKFNVKQIKNKDVIIIKAFFFFIATNVFLFTK